MRNNLRIPRLRPGFFLFLHKGTKVTKGNWQFHLEFLYFSSILHYNMKELIFLFMCQINGTGYEIPGNRF